MEHDEKCNKQDQDLTLLREQFRHMNATIAEVTQRLQDLVLQYHDQNVKQATMMADLAHVRTKVDSIEESLKKDFALRSEFSELKGQWHKFIGIVLTAVLTSILGVVGWGMRLGAGK